MGKNAVVDLFCGAGGMSLGFAAAGFNISLGVDDDSDALQTFSNSHPEASVISKDIELVSASEISEAVAKEPVDVVIGGPPCQGLSQSGRRDYSDPRNRLFLSFVKITKCLRPTAFVLENVPGSVMLYEGRIKRLIKRKFEAIGYRVSVGTLTAANFGVPQMRKRVFFVGLNNHSEPFLFPHAVNFETQTIINGNRWVTCSEAIHDLPSLEGEIGEAMQKYPGPPRNKYQKLMRSGSKYLFNHIATIHTEKVKKIISLVPEGGDYRDLPQQYRDTRNFHDAWKRYDGDKPAPTIDTGHRHHFHYAYNRVPTVRESARLQSFPDKVIFFGNKHQQYSQVGNAVPPLLAKAVADELANFV